MNLFSFLRILHVICILYNIQSIYIYFILYILQFIFIIFIHLPRKNNKNKVNKQIEIHLPSNIHGWYLLEYLRRILPGRKKQYSRIEEKRVKGGGEREGTVGREGEECGISWMLHCFPNGWS